MTEAEWLSSEDPVSMLAHIQGKVSDRKLRLFAVACCRACWGLLTDESFCMACWQKGETAMARCADCGGTGRVNRSRRAVEVAERYADGQATEMERQAAQDAAYFASPHRTGCPEAAAHDACCGYPHEGDYECVPPADQAALLREIVGNPWRPVTLCGMERKPFHNQYAHVDANGGFWLEAECPACARLRTPTVLALATAAYDDRAEDGTLAADRLAVLSDALEDAGCDEPSLLEHLRGTDRHPSETGVWYHRRNGPHVRGCWVVDLLLGKE